MALPIKPGLPKKPAVCPQKVVLILFYGGVNVDQIFSIRRCSVCPELVIYEGPALLSGAAMWCSETCEVLWDLITPGTWIDAAELMQGGRFHNYRALRGCAAANSQATAIMTPIAATPITTPSQVKCSALTPSTSRNTTPARTASKN